MPVCVIVSMAAVLLAVRSLFTGKIVYALLFLAILGIFTPFRSSQFAPVLVSILDLATLTLFAVSPMMLRKSRTPVFTSPTAEKL
jgi:NADH:ubiquinone oxidoreductase subunit 6 (subunit J)